MTLRCLSSTTISDGLPSARRAVAAAVLALAGASAAYAAPDAAGAAPTDQAAPLTITVRPGQSLNDIAVAVTQSHDPGVLARAGRALFDANPQAFMKRDPSRLKIGAQLTVPPLDATGAAAGAPANGASAAVAAAAASGAASHASVSAASAPSHPAAASAASHAAASGAAGFSASGAALGANGASAPGASAPGAAVAHASSAAAQVATAASSGVGNAHVWSGSIQQAPAGANGASAAGAEALLAPGAANHAQSGSAAQPAMGASQARPSSLQQLLALKNRVLMELQKHGIGKPATNLAPTPARPAPAAGSEQKPQASAAAGSTTAGAEAAASEAVAGSATNAASASAATPPVSASPRAAAPWVPLNTGAAVAVGAAAVALIAGFALRRRKKGAPSDAIEPGAFTPAPALDPDAAAAIAGAPGETEEARRDGGEQGAAAVAQHASPGALAIDARRTPVQRGSEASPPADGEAAPARDPQTPAATPLTLEIPRPDEQGGAPRAPESTGDEPSGVPRTGAKPAPYAWRQAFPSDAIAALDSLDMPLPPREPTAADADRTAQSQQAEPTASHSAQDATNRPAAAHPPMGALDADNPHGAETCGQAGSSDFGGVKSFDGGARVTPQQTDNEQRHATALGGIGHGEAAARVAASPATDSTPEERHTQDAPVVRLEQPFAAGADADAAPAVPTPHATAAAEATAPHAATPAEAASHDEPARAAPQGGVPSVPPAHGDPPAAASQPVGAASAAPAPALPNHEPGAPSASPPPLGVAQFGALNLDFDLELPSGPSASLPAFTPEALAKIARNKLELASEYVELGDLAGARTLLHEVIEADHADTRDEARVMLAKLADLS
ncbi:FimV/HubP family polar landmark protein [Burkholderia thailandensis]|uniref:FimV/HubP family polar landmark protein n=1 Tax=Burkholderia thailandensis TaxID=57975 RepID=UPI003F912FF1